MNRCKERYTQMIPGMGLLEIIVLSDDEPVKDGLEEMEDILKRAEVGRIALCGDSNPYIVPVNFLYYGGKIVFHCDWEGKKLNLINKNPRCCFEVDKFMGKVGYHYEARCHLDYDSVLAYGKACIENDGEEKIRLLQLFAEKYSDDYRRPISQDGKRFTKLRLPECCCVVIDIQKLTGRRERTVKGKTEKTMWKHKF